MAVVVCPTTEGWQPRDLLRDILDLVDESIKNRRYPPFVVCFSVAWRPYLKLNYYSPKVITLGRENMTLRERMMEVESIDAVATSPKLRNWEVKLFYQAVESEE